MRYIIDGIPLYSGKCCFLSSLMNILIKNKFNLMETDLFFYLNLLDVQYGFDLNFIGNSFSTAINGLRKNSIEVFEACHKDEADFVLKSGDVLAKECFILLNVNTAELSYNKVYQKGAGRPHFIILYGIDTECETAYIFDSHIREYSGRIATYRGPVLLSEIAKATKLMYWFVIKKCDQPTEREIHEATVRSLTEFLQDHDYELLKRRGINIFKNIFKEDLSVASKNDETGLRGFSALERYVLDFKLLKDLDRGEFSSICTNINYNIRLMAYMHILEFMISLLSDKPIYQFGNYVLYLNSLKELYQGWNKAALIILKIGMTDRRDRISEVTVQCENLLKVQETVFRSILAHISAYQPQ